MTPSITLMVPIRAQAEHGARVKQRLVEMAELTRRESGNIFYTVHEVENRPAMFLVYEQWRDQAALDFHMKQDYLRQFLEESRAWLVEEIAGLFCREI
ncbi:MAG: antibiotic biosynthesis monooxygenase [Candidatus Marinimicrobia bacterium]|nr:antibiotic biosynthesis monooxygenase [Candidatus Neomarinimicrobiota bacterium]